MYADSETQSMHAAITETARRRAIQDAYNKEHGITPKTVVKGVRDVIEIAAKEDSRSKRLASGKLSKAEKDKLIAEMTSEMQSAARRLEFEKAAYLRDEIKKLREGKIDRPENLDLGTCYYLPNFYRLSEEERR